MLSQHGKRPLFLLSLLNTRYKLTTAGLKNKHYYLFGLEIIFSESNINYEGAGVGGSRPLHSPLSLSCVVSCLVWGRGIAITTSLGSFRDVARKPAASLRDDLIRWGGNKEKSANRAGQKTPGGFRVYSANTWPRQNTRAKKLLHNKHYTSALFTHSVYTGKAGLFQMIIIIIIILFLIHNVSFRELFGDYWPKKDKEDKVDLWIHFDWPGVSGTQYTPGAKLFL